MQSEKQNKSPYRYKHWNSIKPGDITWRTVRQPVIKLIGNSVGQKPEHYGIYVGNDTIIDVGGDGGKKITKNYMSTWGVEGFYSLEQASKMIGESPMTRDNATETANVYVGSAWNYDPLANNCQHFVSYCQTKKYYSPQANNGSFDDEFNCEAWGNLGAGAQPWLPGAKELGKLAAKQVIKPRFG